MALKHKTCLPHALIPSYFAASTFFQHIKTTTAKMIVHHVDLPLAHADDVLFFYSNIRQVSRSVGHHRTVYMHVVDRFIRSMLHSVICNDLIRLLKSSSV